MTMREKARESAHYRTNCLLCKRPLPRSPEKGRKRRYCSHTCKMKAYRARHSAAPTLKRRNKPLSVSEPACFVCGHVLAKPKTGRKPRYCSATCKQKAYRKRRFVTRETYRKALRNNVLRLKHKSIEWFTPAEYLRSVKEVLVLTHER